MCAMSETTMSVPRKRRSHIWNCEGADHYVEPARAASGCSTSKPSVRHHSGGGEARWSHHHRRGPRRPRLCRRPGRGFPRLERDQRQHRLQSAVRHRGPLRPACARPDTLEVAIIFPVGRLNAAHWAAGHTAAPHPAADAPTLDAARPRHSRRRKPGGGKTDFCWLVFVLGYTGSPELNWLPRNDGRDGA